MAYEEKDVYAALGMEVPAEQPEVAEPAGQGEKEPSVAETAGGEENTGAEAPREEPEAGAESVPQEEGEQKPEESGTTASAQPMSREERAEQARLRREREQKAAVDAAVLAERQRNEAAMKAMFEQAGMVDRYHDNKPITSLEEFQAFQAARQADKLNRELQSGKLTPESFQAAVNNTPAVREARETVERLKAREKAEAEAARKAEFEAQVREELAEIHRMDPTVNTVDDILAKDTGGEFARLVRENNLSFLQAYKLANADGLAEAKARAAREGAARNAGSKGHLRSITSPAGGVLADVPAETRRIYRDLFPDMTDEQIRKDYAKHMK